MYTQNEVALIMSLELGKKYKLSEVSEVTKLNKDAVLKAAHLLQSKGIAKVESVEKRKYFLTNEGEKYLKEGLPEEKVLDLLKEKKEVNIKDLEKVLGSDAVKIAVGWLKRKDAIEIKNGKIRLVKNVNIEERQALNLIKLGKWQNVEANVLKNLIKRKLVDQDVTKEIFIEILGKPKVEIKDYISDLTPDLIISGKWRNKTFLEYDIRIPSKEIFVGKIHPYEKIIRECRKIFLEMGFTEIKGHYVQPAFWNFDALYQPQDHPARDMQDTFYLNKFVDLDSDIVEKVKNTHENGWITGSTGWGGVWDIRKAQQLVLRTHTTAITIKYLAENPNPPVKAFCIDRVYRREAIDATHLPEFDQLEGVVLDEDVGFRDLLGLLKEFFAKMGFENVRFRPGYFPYTEPSVEPEVYVEDLGWIELGGAGIFRKEVTEPLGIKGKVLAWGLGIGRLAMLKLGLKDLRKLYMPDINWLRSFPSLYNLKARE